MRFDISLLAVITSTRPIHLEEYPRLKVTVILLWALGGLALLASTEHWEWVSPVERWQGVSMAVAVVIRMIPRVLAGLVLWLVTWASLTITFAGLTLFCFGLFPDCQHRDGLSRLWVTLLVEGVVTWLSAFLAMVFVVAGL